MIPYSAGLRCHFPSLILEWRDPQCRVEGVMDGSAHTWADPGEDSLADPTWQLRNCRESTAGMK